MAGPYTATAEMTLTDPKKKDNLLCLLNEQRKRDEFCDYHLKVNGQALAAHKSILAITSPYFDTMFRCAFMESNTDTVDLSDVFPTAEDLDTILDFIYTNKITVNEDSLGQLLNGASHFLMDNLREICAKYMIANLGLQNVLRTWALAELYSLKSVTDVCESLAKYRFHDYLVSSPSSLEVPVDFLIAVILKDTFNLMSVTARARFLLKWAEHNLNERGPQLVTLVEKCCEKLEMVFGRSQNKNFQTILKILEKHATGSKRLSRSRISFRSLKVKAAKPPPKCDIVTCLVKKVDQSFNGYHGSAEIHGYAPSRNDWFHLGTLNLPREHFIAFKSIKGFSRGYVVCDLVGYPNTIGLGDFKNHSMNLVMGPFYKTKVRETKLEEFKHFFCYDDRIFCIMVQKLRHRKKPTAKRRVAAAVASPRPARTDAQYSFVNLLYVYQEGDKWEEVGNFPLQFEVPTERSSTHCMFDSRVIGDQVFILSRTRSDAIGLFFSRLHKVSFHCIRRHKKGYEVRRLTAPNYDSLMIDVKIYMATSCDENLVVTTKRRPREYMDTSLVYDKKTDTWKISLPSLPKAMPREETYILNRNSTIYTPSCYLKNVKGLYAVDFPQVLASRLWYHNCLPAPKTGEVKGWEVLPGPPSLHISKMKVCCIDPAMLDETKPRAVFDDPLLSDKRGPYYNTVSLYLENSSYIPPDIRYSISYHSNSDSSSSYQASEDDYNSYGDGYNSYLTSDDDDDDDDEDDGFGNMWGVW